jgi:hypothetical protein
MGILNSAVKGLRQGLKKGKLGKTIADFLSDNKLNPGSYTEDIARGLGIRTRGARPSSYRFNPHSTGYESHTDLPIDPNVLRPLTGAGYAAQGIGLAGAGTLGAHMIAGTEPSHDENGVKTGKQNEEALKVREKFQKEKLGGANKFNNALLEHNSKNSQWVKTAIKGIGLEKYKKMRAAVAEDPSKASALHTALISELAKVGDEEMMKQAASEPYVLPGLAKVGDNAKRVIVMSPQKGKDKKTSYTALQYEYDEGEDQ